MGTMEEAMEGSWRREREREEDFHRNLPFTDRNERKPPLVETSKGTEKSVGENTGIPLFSVRFLECCK